MIFKIFINEVIILCHKVSFLSITRKKKSTDMTSLAGLPAYLDLAYVSGLFDSIYHHMKVRNDDSHGWTDRQVVFSLILLNLPGGECVNDMFILEKDEGFCVLCAESCAQERGDIGYGCNSGRDKQDKGAVLLSGLQSQSAAECLSGRAESGFAL